MPRLFDTHTHLADPIFDPLREEFEQRARDAGVVHWIIVGTTIASSRRAIELSYRGREPFAAIGIQPNHVAEEPSDAVHRLEAMLDDPRVVAIGETGIDHYWDDTPLPRQRESFAAHVELSLRANLPLIIHSREGKHGDGREGCCKEILEILRRAANARSGIRGVMHSFTGTLPMAQAFLELGLHLSFAGMLTFKNAAEIRAVAAQVPLDRLLIETDSPYLSPDPFRGKYPNEPARVQHTAQCLAGLRGLPMEELAEITTRNAEALFGPGRKPAARQSS